MRDANVGFCNLKIGMIQDFVEENEGFCFVGGIVIHIATECFAEGVCRKMTNVELILEVELFQLAIDVLNRDMAVVFIALKFSR